MSVPCNNPLTFLRTVFFRQVLPMTTHSLHVGQAANPVFAHRLIPLPDRNSVGTLQQGALPAALTVLTGGAACICGVRACDAAPCSPPPCTCWRIFARQRPRGGLTYNPTCALVYFLLQYRKLALSFILLVCNTANYFSISHFAHRCCVCCPLQPPSSGILLVSKAPVHHPRWPPLAALQRLRASANLKH